jgi:hypothetical protein
VAQAVAWSRNKWEPDMNFGLILGAAAAGGMEEGGEAGRKAVASNQEAQAKEDLVKMQLQMEEEKDVKIAAINQDYHVQNTATDYANTLAFEQNRQTFEGGQKAADRQNLKDITGMQGKSALDVAAAQGVNALAVAGVQASSAKYAADLAANKLTVTSGADGKYWLVNNQTGATQQMKDPQGNPIVGVKNLPENVLIAARGMLDQAAIILRMDKDDPAGISMRDSAFAMLGVLPQAPTGPVPKDLSDQFTDIMTKGGRMPTTTEMAQYDRATKTPGAASLAITNWIGQHPSSGNAAPGATPGLPGTPDVNGGKVNQPALVGTAITPSAAAAAPGTTQDNTTVPTTTPAPAVTPAPGTTPAPAVAPAVVTAGTAPTGAGSGAPMGYGEQAPAPGLIAAQMQQAANRFVPRYPSPPRNYPPLPVEPSQYGSRLPSGAHGYEQGNQY